MPRKSPEERREYGRKWYAEHREEQVARVTAWSKAHPERIAETQRKWYAKNGAAYRESHRDELRAATRKWYAAHPEQVKVNNRTQRLRSYGLTNEDYAARLLAQGGVCALCGKAETHLDRKGGITRLAVDHDHATGAVRALLCHACNVGIGTFGDDPDLLRAAAEYIERMSEPGRDLNRDAE